MATIRSVTLVAALGAVTACAPAMRPGALSPVGARVTNEVLEADLHTLDAWTRRVGALTVASNSRQATPERAYMAARAAAWLGFARDAYVADPRDGAADRALNETRQLVLTLEDTTAGKTAGPVMQQAAAIPAGPRADLWATLDSLRASSVAATAPVALADAEVALVRASYLSLATNRGGSALARNAADAARDCDLQLQVTRAEQILTNLRGNASRTASSAPAPVPSAVPLPTPFVVKLAGEAIPPAPAPKEPAASGPAAPASDEIADTLPPMELVVHFTPQSSKITPQSKVALNEVIVGLRAHRAARIQFEAFTGKRVGEQFDRPLAQRRAAAVRKYLSDAKLDLAKLTRNTNSLAVFTFNSVADLEAGRPASRGGLTPTDARLTLAFIGADGRSLTVAGMRDDEMERAEQERRSATSAASTKSLVRDRTTTAPR